MFRNILSIAAIFAAFALAVNAQQARQESEVTRAFSVFPGDDGGYLGVQVLDISKENFGKFGLSAVRGVAVEKVLENSPAAAAGIKDGDVILRFNGEDVASARKLTRLIGETAADHQARLTISRGGSEQEVTVTLGKRPGPRFSEGTFTMPPMGQTPDLRGLERLREMPVPRAMPRDGQGGIWTTPESGTRVFSLLSGSGRVIGVGVFPVSEQLARHFNVAGGLLVNDVRENSAAAKAGVKAGDIIVEVNGKAVRGDIDLIREVNAKKEGDVQLTVVRDGKRQTISVTPEPAKDGAFFFDTGGDVVRPMTPPARPAPAPRPAVPMGFGPRRIV